MKREEEKKDEKGKKGLVYWREKGEKWGRRNVGETVDGGGDEEK